MKLGECYCLDPPAIVLQVVCGLLFFGREMSGAGENDCDCCLRGFARVGIKFRKETNRPMAISGYQRGFCPLSSVPLEDHCVNNSELEQLCESFGTSESTEPSERDTANCTTNRVFLTLTSLPLNQHV